MSAVEPKRFGPKRVQIPVGHGSLEGLLQEAEIPVASAIVCHPHPLHGGTMENNVVWRMARALNEQGAEVLRFNFRGVGRSTGSYGYGIDEEEDVLAAIAFLRARAPERPLWVAGFSFGARVGLSVGARDLSVERLLGVGLPLKLFELHFLRDCAKPKVFVQGALDEYAGGAETRAFVESLPPPRHLEVVPGAEHLFTRKLPELAQALGTALSALRAM